MKDDNFPDLEPMNQEDRIIFQIERIKQVLEDDKETIAILREENKKLKTELELANERIRELQT